MRKITTAVTAAALAFSMLASAVPAAAVTGYDSQYNSESAFVNITAPVGATNGIYRFNGDLVVSTTGERIHPEGYYQEANLGGVSGTTPVLSTISPTFGTSNGGTPVTLTGTGFVCTPAFPSVSF